MINLNISQTSRVYNFELKDHGFSLSLILSSGVLLHFPFFFNLLYSNMPKTEVADRLHWRIRLGVVYSVYFALWGIKRIYWREITVEYFGVLEFLERIPFSFGHQPWKKYSNWRVGLCIKQNIILLDHFCMCIRSWGRLLITCYFIVQLPTTWSLLPFLEIFSVKCVIVLAFFCWQAMFGKHRISANLEWCPALPYSDRENLTFNSIELLTLK